MFERLTIRTDICAEPENDIIYSNPNDPEGMYNILDLASLSDAGDGTEAGILLNISYRLAEYEDTGLTPAEVAELAQAKADGRLVVLPCPPGTIYAGICREQRPSKRGWKTHSWIETGKVTGLETCVCMTADKAGYEHQRPLDELGEVWFIGDSAREEAEKALKESDNNERTITD